MININPSILLFDGTCNLCNRLVQFVIRRDHRQKIFFGTLQSESGQKAVRNSGLNDQQFDSIVFLKDNKIYLKSMAILEILGDLGGIWRLFKIFVWIPRPVRDWIYDIIAKNRYNIFGKWDQCMVPGPDLKNRFLE